MCCHFLTCQLILMCVCILSCFSHVWLCVTPWTVAPQAPLSIGILQARILEWVAMPSSRGSSWPRDQTVSLNLLHWQVDSYHWGHLGSPYMYIYICMYKYLIKLVKICLTGHFKELILIYISSALFPSVLISPLL